ncbi:MAG TPA: glycerate kinase, partial [Aggregatilineales bacterium]|nr:glycerate kinase [Aggregatilineales bacterium]
QTAGGKAVQAVASAAAAVGVPVIAFCGALNMTPEALRKLGIAAAFGIAPHPAALKESMAQAAVWLESAAAQVGMLTDALSQR